MAIGVTAAAILVAGPAWAGTLTVTRVWPERIVYKSGETARIDVEIANASKAEATATVSLVVRYGLDATDEVPAQTVTVPAGGKATAKFAYAVSKDRKWGHEAVATLRDADGAVQSTGREYFTVGGNPWEVGHYRTLFYIRGAKKDGRIDGQILPGFRKMYITTIEAYDWAPSHFDCMTPSTNVWRSGQSNYKEGKEDWQYLVRRAHDMGMSVVTYIQSSTCGPVGLEFVRRHPDWLAYDAEGRPRVQYFDVDQLATRQADPDVDVPNNAAFYALTGRFLPGHSHVGDYWIQEMIRSKEMFNWDGFRSDGTPGPTSGRDYTGKLSEWKDPDAAQAEFVTKVRRELTSRHPDFRFGWNFRVFDPEGRNTSPKEANTVIPGCYMLWEAFNSSPHPSSVLHDWKRMAHEVQREAGYIRERGGFSHVGWMPSNRYMESVVSASGSHTDSWAQKGSKEGYTNYRRFELRWAEFLWDIALRYVRPGSDAVSVEGPAQVWWKDFVHTRDLAGGGKRVIVHLLNMPEEDDEAWADRPPAPAADVKVTFKTQDGKKHKKIAVLSPDTEGDVVTVTPGADGSVTIPEVTLWTLVVAEF